MLSADFVYTFACSHYLWSGLGDLGARCCWKVSPRAHVVPLIVSSHLATMTRCETLYRSLPSGACVWRLLPTHGPFSWPSPATIDPSVVTKVAHNNPETPTSGQPTLHISYTPLSHTLLLHKTNQLFRPWSPCHLATPSPSPMILTFGRHIRALPYRVL